MAVVVDPDRSTANALLPDGSNLGAVKDTRIADPAYQGTYPTWEHYESVPSAQTPVRTLRIWADEKQPKTRRIPGLPDTLRAVSGVSDKTSLKFTLQPAPPRPYRSGPLTPELLRQDFVVPFSRRIEIEALVYIEEIIPSVRGVADLYLKASIDGNPTYSKSVIVKSGLTEYNETGAPYNIGRMQRVIIELDASAFARGSTWPMVLKANASVAGRFQYVQ